ncbi:ComF family protein [Pseudomarimonas arenosa]|uniref:ComF family protein n=1 Tax=Pseudomarimonas arenosa TaxID=2774145 RepID=A0AAW3ZJZ6_9GAMM|nr:ComF family protein [Pseudomarimonas arenosa]MBD8525844.1 ComF family protein [Pseudomarimonas arenosa]
MSQSIPWRAVLGQGLNLLLPRRCLACGMNSPAEQAFCPPCLTELPWLGRACQRCALPLPAAEPSALCGRCLRRTPPQRSALALFLYADPIDRLLARLKFSADLAAGAGLATQLQALLDQRLSPTDLDLLLPLPLHAQRWRERGYNQSAELLRGCASAWRARLAPELLTRNRASAPQSDLNAGQRRRNVRGVFSASERVAGRRVLLVDDVITTGSTLSEATRTLLAAGAAEVHWLALARAPSRR